MRPSDRPRLMMKKEDTFWRSVLIRQATTKTFPTRAITPRTQMEICRAEFDMRSLQEENSSAAGVHTGVSLATQQKRNASEFRMLSAVMSSKVPGTMSRSGLFVMISHCNFGKWCKVDLDRKTRRLLFKFNFCSDRSPRKVPSSS